MMAYTDDDKARALAMARTGSAVEDIVEVVGAHRATVYRWLSTLTDAELAMIRRLRQRNVGLKAADLFEAKIEEALDNPSTISLTQAGIAYGISTDKELKQQQLDQDRQFHEDDYDLKVQAYAAYLEKHPEAIVNSTARYVDDE